MKNSLKLMTALVLAAMLAGCGNSGDSSDAQIPDPATQPEAQAAMFQRMADRAKSLIESKNYQEAQTTLKTLKSYKLTPEQQQIVDQLQARIPAN